ncbi:MAG: sigma-70 family RNA polymerase sigma factor [Candidatus Omnitrophica bacterium]|jgi:RNA polymerase sigma factor (sigma-70 family)|nr:sigma-70 family RNA polymerase sigma factor [Candidatus Omnitrophota bacterium]
MKQDFSGTLKRITPKLKGIAYKLAGMVPFLNQEDLFQEALVHLWVGFRDSELQDKTDSYILQGCYFHLKNYIRTVSDKKQTMSLDAFVNDNNTTLEKILPVEDSNLFLEQLNSQFIFQKIRNNGLTSQEKEVFNLYYQGLSARKVASRMGLSHVRVLRLKDNIRKRYQHLLQE